MPIEFSQNLVFNTYISNNATTQTVIKGKRIFKADLCVINKLDISQKTVFLTVESETYFNKFYKVVISFFDQPDNIAVVCTCPATETQLLCKHGVAALFALELRLIKNTYEEAFVIHESGMPLLNMQDIDETTIRNLLNKDDWTKAKQLAYASRAKINMDINQTATATLLYKNVTYNVTLQKVGNKQFVSSCSCLQKEAILCMHRAAVFLQLSFNHGKKAFELMQDWTVHKNKLLAEYGFSLNDDLSGKFDFIMDSDKPKLKLLDPTIVKINDLTWFTQKQNKTISIPVAEKLTKKIPLSEKPDVDHAVYGIGYVFCITPNKDLPYFSVLPVTGKLNPEHTRLISNINTIITNNGTLEFKDLPVLDETDFSIINICKELTSHEIRIFARTKLKVQFSIEWYRGFNNVFRETDMNAEQNIAFWQHIQLKITRLFDLLANKLVYLSQMPQNLSANNIKSVKIVSNKAIMCFSVIESGDFIELKAALKLDNEYISISDSNIAANLFLIHNQTICLLHNQNQPEIFNSFLQKPVIKVKRETYPTLLNNVILPLQNHFEVNNEIPITFTDAYIEPKAQLYLKESEDYLIMQPIADYGGKQLELDGNTEVVYLQNQEIIRLTRDIDFEAQLKDFVLHLHPTFEEQLQETGGLYFYLHYESVMDNGWFLNSFEEIINRKIEIFGFKSLSKFHFNLNKPKLSFNKVSSGIDWFDIQADVMFGDLSVSLKDVQKAIIKKDNFVKLSDGSLGMLPQEWLNKYAALFKLADAKGKNNLQISKLHFSIIDTLYAEINQEDVLKELTDKRNKFKNFSQITNVAIPAQIQANLRPYQKSGFNWLNFLHEFSWGGCLADDMGLGKTLQILTFLQHLKEQNGPSTNLVVVPTSLIFNWEAEVKKFCTGISILRYHGPERHKITLNQFKNYDIIITSYGTLTSDINKFIRFSFNYLILDESQSIKNPETKRYKAVRLLTATNRLALTGTPIENNTFDLYAQLNFLNPGMLGTVEFFKEQYSNPIDKNNDPERVAELRRIVFPFILRRSKELVAKDLPEKTETILYCEMGTAQRKVYEAFRDNYRFKILDRINTEGMSRAGMYILEGLMKLRQICDSPTLLKDAEDYGHESVKLKELMKHIIERTGNHKILVFSQFLGMLALVRKQLKAHKINFTYLDGATNPAEREDAVRIFQTDTSCRVFLVSLKAGGMGLNLTAADYVFLVDPWWNPAVEQQAIDRTHRIGQTNHVFAYKMICKDTVEEKILALQQKKRTLAAELISTDKGFIKNLSKSDVEYLFS